MSLLRYLDKFLSTLCTRVKSSRPDEFFKKGVSKNFTNSKENIFAEVSFAIMLQAGGRQLYSMQNLAEVLSCEFCENFQGIYCANVFAGLPLKNKIFAKLLSVNLWAFTIYRTGMLFVCLYN